MKTLIMTPLPRAPDLSVVLGDWLKKAPFQHPKIGREVEFEFAFAVPLEQEDEIWRRLRRFRGEYQCHAIPVPPIEKAFAEVAADWAQGRFGEISLYRNLLLDFARAEKPEQAIFLDSDVVPRKGFIDRFRADGKDACAGVVRTFNNNWDEVLGYGTFREPWFSGLEWGRHTTHEGNLIRVDFANAACLYLGQRVLADERARFEPVWVDFEGAKLRLSEDHAFSRLLYALGYDLFVDETLRCDHFRNTPKGARWLKA